MRLLYISCFMFKKKEGKTYGLPSCADSFFSKYLSVFESVRVLGENVKEYLDDSRLVELKENKIEVEILPRNTSPKDLKNDRIIKKILEKEIEKAEAILIKPATRKGIMAIKIAEKMKKPYMIEMTGDIHNALKQNPSFLKRAYSPILFAKIRKAIKNCPYGLYVSKEYLQSQYPIKGKMLGCADVVVEDFSKEILDRRMIKIENMDAQERIDLGLIGFYQGNGKGVDTAIRALSRLPKFFHLSVLGNGTEQSRKYWYDYAGKYGVKERLHFCDALPSVQDVFLWLDKIDVFVLPTRSEGLCRVVVEAMSRACPCFATNICTMPELLLGECLHSLDDDETLATQILSCVEDREKMKALAKRNFEKAQEYRWDILKQRRDSFLAEYKRYCENKISGE